MTGTKWIVLSLFCSCATVGTARAECWIQYTKLCQELVSPQNGFCSDNPCVVSGTTLVCNTARGIKIKDFYLIDWPAPAQSQSGKNSWYVAYPTMNFCYEAENCKTQDECVEGNCQGSGDWGDFGSIINDRYITGTDCNG